MRRLRPTVLALGALCVVASSAERVGAQVFDTSQMINDHVRMQNQIVTDMLIRNSMEGKRSSGGKSAPSRGRQPASPGTRGAGGATGSGPTTFRPVADQIVPQQLARDVGRTPEERARLERMFGDLLANYKDRLKQANAPANDVARAASYLVGASYLVYNDGTPLTDAQRTALRAQMSDAFSTDPAFQRLTDRERQQMFERFGITGTWLDAGYEIVKKAGDRKAMAQWREMARKNFESMLGASPEKVRFTDTGFEYK